jgi:hypothetical protein
MRNTTAAISPPMIHLPGARHQREPSAYLSRLPDDLADAGLQQRYARFEVGHQRFGRGFWL